MSKLEQLTPNAAVRGILPEVVRLGGARTHLQVPQRKVANEILYRHDEARIEVVELGRPWSF